MVIQKEELIDYQIDLLSSVRVSLFGMLRQNNASLALVNDCVHVFLCVK